MAKTIKPKIGRRVMIFSCSDALGLGTIIDLVKSGIPKIKLDRKWKNKRHVFEYEVW